MLKFVIVLMGFILGSFLNMLIYRLPRGESIWGPRSHCPFCGVNLNFFDLIPFFSYLFLRGRCRYCHEHIPIRYLLVELSTALAFLIFYLVWGFNWYFGRAIILFLLLFPLAIIDWEHQILPNQLTFLGLGLGLLLSLTGGYLNLGQALLGALVGGGFLLIIALAYPRGMGGGDIKMMAMVGSFVGWSSVLGIIFLGAILGLVYFGLSILLKKVKKDSPLPFGTFLAISTFLILFWGARLLDLYLGLIGFY